MIARPLLPAAAAARPRTAIFMSGSGTNAERLLERWTTHDQADYEVVALVTDRPETSRAQALAAQFGLPLVAHDILAFYRARGQTRVSLATCLGQQTRSAWTAELRRLLAPCRLDFAVFAGFVPLTNLTADLPCLNVHPGDLLVTQDGQRLLVGLHDLPVERALLAGHASLRSSVLLAAPVTGSGGDMDNGTLLGVSAPVPIQYQGQTPAALQALAAARPAKRPSGGWQDALAALAATHLELLKQGGDWVLLPPLVRDFARGCYGLDDAGRTLFRSAADQAWAPVAAVEYGRDARRPLPLV
jgi:folate-dependent phosphoribosylglycinamide formyltransferase PurN